MNDLTAAIMADLGEVERRYGKSKLAAAVIGRGFHALLFYRLARQLRQWRIPLLPLVLTRIIQVLYGIELDPDARLAAGICIVHGNGVVVGDGAAIGTGCLLYHGVTLGIKGTPRGDGFPTIGRDCVLGAGCTILGPVVVGDGSVIGANVMLAESVEAGSIVKCAPPVIAKRQRKTVVAQPVPLGDQDSTTDTSPDSVA